MVIVSRLPISVLNTGTLVAVNIHRLPEKIPRGVQGEELSLIKQTIELAWLKGIGHLANMVVGRDSSKRNKLWALERTQASFL